MSPAVRMSGVTKRFGRLVACDRVDLEVARGATHAIVGENGAGKTTLMRVLYGLYRPDAGNIEIAGKPVRFGSPSEAIRAGIGMVSQHYSIIGELTCLDNLMLGAELAHLGVLKRSEAVERAQRLAARMGFQFDWYAPAETLTPAGCQKLEILKLLWREVEILILDEPTAMLSPPDAQALFSSLRELADDGRTIILVTHRLREVVDHCDRVTVLRAGRKVGESDVADTDVVRLSTWIVGEEMRPRLDVGSSVHEAPVLLDVRDLHVLGDRRNRAVAGLSLQVRAGEVAGIAGVDGNGQAELSEALIGVRPTLSGTIRLLERDVTREPPVRRLRLGLRFIAADRHRHGLIETWDLLNNAILGLQRLPPLARGPLLSAREQMDAAKEQVERFHIKVDSLRAPVSELSGGNQQRLVVARALHLDAKLLLAFQPSRGLDVRGTASVYEQIRTQCLAGMGALVISFDLDELIENCEPIYVMRDGRLVAELRGEQIDRERIGRLMVGVEEGAA
ncbi:MAG: ABC transporter ATP-binding protein [Fimbriimonadia bacterium]